MIAGRELDALVAEKVMGFVRARGAEAPGTPPLYREPHGSGGPVFDLPAYSADIAAAWTAVERLHRDFEYVRILTTEDGATVKIPLADGRFARAMDDTAPLAICLAALEAVGSGVA